MSNKLAHISQAEHNENLANELSKRPINYKDWVVIVLFYSAVHYFESTWVTLGWHSQNHKDRNDYIKRNYRRDTKLRTQYRALEENGWLARYLNNEDSCTANEYFTEEDIDGFFEKLAEIKRDLKIS